MTETTDAAAAEAFAAFLDGQLSRKQNLFTIQDDDGGSTDDAASNQGGDDRDNLISGAIQRHGLHPDDADILAGIPDADLDTAAERLAALIKEDDPNAPRRPRPDRAQGQSSDYPRSDPAAVFGDWLSNRLAGR
jgi:hypothetical protein